MAKSKGTKKTISIPENKQKALELAKAAVEKEFGKGIVVTNKDHQFPEIERISSGCLGLDKALNGGYPRGRIIEIFGESSSGKSTLALHAIASCQKQGGIALYVDLEHAYDAEYSENLGVDIDELLFSQPSSGEDCLNIVETYVRSGAIDLVVVDSVAALVSRSELEGNIGDSSVGQQARLMSQAMRMLTGPVHKTNTTLIMNNQTRQKIGIMYGPNECVTPNTMVDIEIKE